MTVTPDMTRSMRRRLLVSDIREAVSTAEGLARSLAGQTETEVQAQALLNRLAAIRAEIDLIDLYEVMTMPRADPLVRPPAEGPRPRQTPP